MNCAMVVFPLSVLFNCPASLVDTLTIRQKIGSLAERGRCVSFYTCAFTCSESSTPLSFAVSLHRQISKYIGRTGYLQILPGKGKAERRMARMPRHQCSGMSIFAFDSRPGLGKIIGA